MRQHIAGGGVQETLAKANAASGSLTKDSCMRRMSGTSASRDNDFFARVWAVVDRIPCGKVTTYGHIAAYLGARSAARSVGWALGAAAGGALPCHRVVNRFGALTGRMRFGGPHVMEERLRSEGVTFDENGCVALEAHLWDPSDSSGETGSSAHAYEAADASVSQ